MKKISIAQRRLESSRKFAPGDRHGTETGKTLFFPDQKQAHLMSNDRQEAYRDGPEPSADNSLIEIDLTPFQEEKLESAFKTDSETRLYGTLRRCSSGVLYLNLEHLNPELPHYVSAEAIARMLAVSRKTVYRLHRRNLLSGMRVGRCLRFNFKDVLDYLDSCVEKGMGENHVS